MTLHEIVITFTDHDTQGITPENITKALSETLEHRLAITNYAIKTRPVSVPEEAKDTSDDQYPTVFAYERVCAALTRTKMILDDVLDLGQRIREEIASREPFSEDTHFFEEWEEMMERVVNKIGFRLDHPERYE